MNNRHEYALNKPLVDVFGLENYDPNYHEHIHKFGLKLSTLLTVENAGDGYQWHFSVAVMGTEGPIPPIGSLDVNRTHEIIRYMKAMLSEVGQGELHTIMPQSAFHMFRKLSAAELARVSKHAMAAGN